MGTLSTLGFTTTAPDYVTMGALGYDVTTLGTHEFDFGP
jgi:2',3'-cyclic-nucleotide 2'-phosphodiesterase (5'-nucleotidase family)